jgi:teichuronic acid biosynthesis glycosyltransferase TuaC
MKSTVNHLQTSENRMKKESADSAQALFRGRKLKVLVLSRSYPNNNFPLLGVWVENLVRHSARLWDTKVVSPVPYCPPLARGEYFDRFRKTERHRISEGVEVFYPRFLMPPGLRLHGIESITYYLAVVRLIDRLRKSFDFDLIHAHFTFPDGCVAALLGKRYGVPAIITEQASWQPWMENFRLVRRQAVWAARRSVFHIAISNALRKSIATFTGDSTRLRIIPDGVDGSVFTLPKNDVRPLSNQILFVGNIRPVKGVDVLIKAMQILARRRPDVKLVLVGESFYKNYRIEYDRLRDMVSKLGLESQVEFVGKKSNAELVHYLQESALLVLPSRRETLGTVLLEALACGTPVVATRCGGPEDIVTDEVGVLVPTEDPEALARGIEQVLDARATYDPVVLRAHALEKFGLDSVNQRVGELYARAMEGRVKSTGRESAVPLGSAVTAGD